MTRAEAHELLDAARAGCNISQAEIMRALRATGDLAQNRGKRERTISAAQAVVMHRVPHPHLQQWAGQILRANQVAA